MTIAEMQKCMILGRCCSTCKRGRPDVDGNIECRKPQVLEMCGVCDLWEHWEEEKV